MQRLLYKKNKIPEERIKKLEKIEGWYWEKDFEDVWDETYNKLNDFINKNKYMPSNKSKNIEEKQLGTWCNNQRNNKRLNKLSNDRIKKLEEINEWYWYEDEPKKLKTFDENYDAVEQWIKINKKIPSAKSKDIDEKQLGTFCSTQRKNKRNNKLSNEKIDKLEKLKYWYWEKNKINKQSDSNSDSSNESEDDTNFKSSKKKLVKKTK